MARIETWFNQDLTQPVKVHYLDGNVFSQDNKANVIGVNVFDNGTPASLSGTVSANIIRPDGATVSADGVLSGNQVSVAIPSAAYAVPGVISIIIKLYATAETTTLCAVVANVYQSSTDTIVDPGTIIPSVEALIEAIDDAVASIPQDYSVLSSTVGAGLATNAKNIVSCDLVFFKASGYKADSIISTSTGEIGAGTGTGNNWVYEDFIPVPKNETIYFQQHPDCLYNAFFYDDNFVYIGCANPTESSMFGITYKNANAAYVRFGCYKSGGYSSAYDAYVFGFASNCDPYGVLVNGYTNADGTITSGMTIIHSANIISSSEPIEYVCNDSSLKLGVVIYDSNDNILYKTGNESGQKYICVTSNTRHRLFARYSTYDNINISEFPFDKLSINKSGFGHYSFGSSPGILTPNVNRFGAIDIEVAETDFVIHYPNSTNGDNWNGIRMSLEFYDESNTNVVQGWYTIKYDVLVPKGTHFRYNIGKNPDAETGKSDYDSVLRIVQRDNFEPQIHGLYEQLGIIRARLSALEGNTIPSYYQTHIETKAQAIETLYSNTTTGDQFVFITDYHANGYNQTGHSMVLIDYLLNHSHLYKVFNGGDILNTWSLRNSMNYAAMRNLVRTTLQQQTPNAPCAYYEILGNHDTGKDYDGQGNECGPFITAQELFDISGQGVSHPYAVRDNFSFGWGYYFDDNVNKIRYLVMNGGLSSYGSGEGDWDILQFVVDVLSATPSGYTVVAFNHIILNIAGTALINFVTNVASLFDAYNSRTSVTIESGTYDFSGAVGGPVACLIGGHNHYDWDGTSTGGIPIIATTTDNRGGSADPSLRPAGTVNEQAFDVFTINTTSKTINATRIGSGSDRSWTYGS